MGGSRKPQKAWQESLIFDCFYLCSMQDVRIFYAGDGMGISIALMGFEGDLDRRALQGPMLRMPRPSSRMSHEGPQLFMVQGAPCVSMNQPIA
jgi:hypothetical protein